MLALGHSYRPEGHEMANAAASGSFLLCSFEVLLLGVSTVCRMGRRSVEPTLVWLGPRWLVLGIIVKHLEEAENRANHDDTAARKSFNNPVARMLIASQRDITARFAGFQMDHRTALRCDTPIELARIALAYCR